eukprot:5520432-Amphidinium_carterae.1
MVANEMHKAWAREERAEGDDTYAGRAEVQELARSMSLREAERPPQADAGMATEGEQGLANG